MRTLYYSEGTANEIKVIVNDEFTFVFQPNYAEVELGSNYSATEEVTLTDGTITLKRNCINRKCVFDLSLFLETAFTFDNLNILYLADNDDLTISTVLLDLTADSNKVDVDFVAKWGALQPDDVLTYDIKFPYWHDLPLFVNTDFEHDNILIDGVSNTNNYVYIIDRESGGDFTFETKLAGNSVTKITFEDTICPSDGHYLSWIDTHGRFWHYKFFASKESLRTLEVKSGAMIPVYPLNMSDFINGKERVISKSRQRSFGCFASVPEEIYFIIESIISSPVVRYYSNYNWIGVQVSDVTMKAKKGGYVDIEFEVKLPSDYIQKL